MDEKNLNEISAQPNAETVAENISSGLKRKNKFSASLIAKIAMFSALASVLQLWRIPIPVLFPPWLELNFADVPALIGTFALGPVSGSIIVILKIAIKLMIHGTSSAFTGDLSDLICGLMLIIPAGIIYKRNRTFKGAVLALAISSVFSTGVSVLSNRFIIVPAYAKAFGGIGAIANLVSNLFPSITAENFYNYYLPLSVVPFNLMRCIIASIITMLVYKRISWLLNKF